MSSAPDAFRPFRPRLARTVCLVIGVLIAVGTIALIVSLPAFYDRSVVADMAGIGVVGAGAIWFCWRQASVAALPDGDGLLVRNLIYTRRLEWAQIVLVRFGDRPWVQLDLADGDTLAVMAVQRADGDFGRAEAARLAALVEARSAA